MDTNENSFKDWSELLPGPEESRVLEKSAGNKEKALDEDTDDSDGVPILPFKGIQNLVNCRICRTFVYFGTELKCSVRDCQAAYHLECAQKSLRASSSKKFKCPQHACYLCKQKHQLLRCTRCELAWHAECAAFSEHVKHLKKQPGKAICWRSHETKKTGVQVNSVEEVFLCLPVPDQMEDFDIDSTWKSATGTEMKPLHMSTSGAIVKQKREEWVADIKCADCISSYCSKTCVCRVHNISCSKACSCTDMCTNRLFRREKRIKVVKTELCGWGVEAAEPINKGDFVIEYVGEDDALCEERLSNLGYMGVRDFYMCQVQKDFTIDSTFKGNTARFLNHSCDPNCSLEKWQLDGETRIGVFAARAIQEGEPLTYDYRYLQFGREVKCKCGTSNCRGYLGAKKNSSKVEKRLHMDSRGKRTANKRRRS